MRKIIRFLRPTVYKLIFLVEWLIYGLIAVVQNRFVIQPILLNILWPFGFFYLVGCGFVAANRRCGSLWSDRRALAVAVMLVAVDHLIKFVVSTQMTLGQSLTILPGRLNFAYVVNEHGSWAAASTGSKPVVTEVLVFAILVVITMPLIYRFYATVQRRSLWVVSAYVWLMAGEVSAVMDLGLRGATVDYFSIPGHFVCDLKDIYLMIGVALVVVELVDNPRIELSWKGWREEYRETRDTTVQFGRFAIKDLYGLRRRR